MKPPEMWKNPKLCINYHTTIILHRWGGHYFKLKKKIQCLTVPPNQRQTVAAPRICSQTGESIHRSKKSPYNTLTIQPVPLTCWLSLFSFSEQFSKFSEFSVRPHLNEKVSRNNPANTEKTGDASSPPEPESANLSAALHMLSHGCAHLQAHTRARAHTSSTLLKPGRDW